MLVAAKVRNAFLG